MSLIGCSQRLHLVGGRDANSTTSDTDRNPAQAVEGIGPRPAGRLALRAKIVLLAADGRQNKPIAAQVSVWRQLVARWRNRFVQAGVEKDAPRPGRKPAVGADKVLEVSSAGESHPDALSEPYVNVSAHTAPAKEPRRTPICQCANSPGSRREMRAIQCIARRRWPRSFLYFR